MDYQAKRDISNGYKKLKEEATENRTKETVTSFDVSGKGEVLTKDETIELLVKAVADLRMKVYGEETEGIGGSNE